MTPVRDLLVQAGELLLRGSTPTQFAVNASGERCRPLDPDAVAWTTYGALAKLAPRYSAQNPNVHADITSVGEAAWALLEQAAEQQGHWSSSVPPEGDPTGADRAGIAAVSLLFRQAISLAESQPSSRPRAGSRAGSLPRGADAI